MHFKKFRKRKNKFVLHKMAPYIVLTVVFGLSIAYSSFASKMNITGLLTTVRIEKDVRITGVSVVGDEVETLCNLVSDNGDVGISVGDEYSCEVKEDTWYTFYVLSTNNSSGEIITDDTSDKIVTSVNLMLNSNVYYKSATDTGLATAENPGTVSWYYENGERVASKGPVTAINYLNNATKTWTKLGNININYTDARTSYTIRTSATTTTISASDGTQTVSFENLKARMPIKSEIDSIVNDLDFYLYNLDLITNYGYWLLNGVTSGSNGYAYRVNSSGIGTNSVYVNSQFGVRPVITVHKSEMETTSSDSSLGTNGESTYHDYNVNNISSGINLPEEDSSVTFNVEITNIGNAEVGIVDITGLPDNLTYNLLDYELKEKLCDRDSQCSLGIKKYIKIEVKYKDGGYDSSNTHYDIVLDFNFQQFYPIEYVNVEKSPCGLVLGDGTNLGDIVQCGVEQFYVIENDGINVTMLTARGIKPSETEPGQSSNFLETMAFSQDAYWYDSTNKVHLIDEDYLNEGKKYPYVYGEYEGNLIYPYVNAYEDYLINELKIESASATIMSYEQAVSLGCIDDVGCAVENGGTAPKWLAYPGHWLGSALKSSLWRIGTLNGFNAGHSYYDQFYSVRPVVTIAASEIENQYPLEILGGEDLTITFSGNAPSEVTVRENNATIDRYTYSEGILIVTDVKGNIIINAIINPTSICTLALDSPSIGTIPGTKYHCKVDSEKDEYIFYVLSTNNDSSGILESANLIMSGNICKDGTIGDTCYVAWDSSGTLSNGPVTAMTYLNTATSSWIDELLLNETHDDTSGNYTGFVLNGKARLPKHSELTGAGCNSSSCPDYLIGKYWTLTTRLYNSKNYAWASLGTGVGIKTPTINSQFGVRPVIKLPIDQLN